MSYDSEGKKNARELVIEVAKRTGCETFLDLWGGGESARMAAAAGLFVTSAENDSTMREAMFADASDHGYDVFAGDVTKVPGQFDFVFADFCGGANPTRFEELRSLSTKATNWLAVTLAPDHQQDPHMQGEAAVATVPAWLMSASRMRLVYLGRYVRNVGGTTMWFAILQPRHINYASRGGIPYDPIAVERCIRGPRSYWASRRFGQSLPGLLTHKNLTPVGQVKIAPRRCLWCLTLITPTVMQGQKILYCPKPSRCGYMKNKHPNDTILTIERECVECNTRFVPTKVGLQKCCKRNPCGRRYSQRRYRARRKLAA